MSVNLNFPNLTLLTNGSPYKYISQEEYMNLTEIETDKLYWILNPKGSHCVYKNGSCIEGFDFLNWETIKAAVRDNTIKNYFSIGDQLPVNYNGSAVLFDIVAFDVATPADSNYTHSMTLMPHNCLESLMFDNKEPNNSDNGRKSYGNNRYSYSNIRQWLNSSGEAGNWWTAQHDVDAAPDYADTKAGFMSYFDNDFLSVIGKTTIRTAKNTTIDGGGYEDLSDEYFYLPSTTEVGLTNENSIAEGAPFPYFDSNAKRVKYYNGSTKYWWLRTPSASSSNYVRRVNTGGTLNYIFANSAYGIAPACNII